MMNLLVLALLLQTQPDGIGLEAPKDWTRMEDPQKRFILFVPPGIPQGKDGALLVFNPAEFSGSADEYLDALIRNANQGSQLLGQIQKFDVGKFRSAVFTAQTAQGSIQYVGIHAARWGNRAQGVLFATSDREFYKVRSTEVHAMLNRAVFPQAGAVPAPAAVEAGAAEIAGLVLPLPAGWTRQQDASGWTILDPPANAFYGSPRLWVPPSRKLEGSHWEAHRALMKQLIEAAKWPGSYVDMQDVAPGPFIQSYAHCSTDARGIRLYTAAGEGTLEAIAITPVGGDDLIRAVYSFFEKTKLKKPAAEPKRPEVKEAYRRVNMKKYMNIDGSTFYGRLAYERLLLLSNGVTDCNACYAEGYGGNAALLKIDSGTQNGFYGKWVAEDKTVRIRRDARNAEEVYTRENGNLKFGDQVWTPIPRVDGLKLKGRYAYKSSPGVGIQFNYWVEFTEDGAFKTGGLLTWLAVGDLTNRAKPPETASGTYEIKDWTLWFKVDGAVVWSTDFTPLLDDVKDLGTVLINTYSFKRE